MDWKLILRQNFTHWKELSDFLDLSLEQRKMILERPEFSLNLPLRLAQKIVKRTLDDPILKQFLPSIEEKIFSEQFAIDPVEDVAFKKAPKLLQKYPGRVLLVCTSACAVHCRYCFRQNFDYEGSKLFTDELAIIAEDASIREVILSGGDPLSLNNETLHSLLYALSAIPHVKRIRFHTRFPVGIPERIDHGFLSIIEKIRPSIWFVIQSNHPRELDDTIFNYLRLLQERRVIVLNQAVLLRGINDRVEVLQELCELLVDQGILPYYLHQLDRVKGSAHFEVPKEEGEKIIKDLTSRISGYAVPKYVCEIAGEKSKTHILSTV